jgi:outer membrane protein, heavy metal efflux system
MKRMILFIATCCVACATNAQSSVEVILKQVETNNKSLQSNHKYWEARRAEFKTGLNPYDPQVEYDYLFGSPVGAGNQEDFTITQRLDFPTTYKRKRELSREQVAQTRLQQSVYRQNILLEAKLLLLEVIYLNKRAAELSRRRSQTEQLVVDYQKKLEKGDVIILDVNKAKLQLLNIQNEEALNTNALELAATKLSLINGGVEISITDTTYPELPVVPDFETLDSMIEARDPIVKVYAQDKVTQQRAVSVQRSLNLPKIETGYHSQGILGQSYRGFHAGVTIPLWENRNRVKAAEANLEHAKANEETHRVEHRLENKQHYQQLEVRRNYMLEYYRLMSSLNNLPLLEKALRLGQITIIEFFQDQNYYFSTHDKYLQLEWEYQQAVARLYKFAL